jgi:hypothetical protein
VTFSRLRNASTCSFGHQTARLRITRLGDATTLNSNGWELATSVPPSPRTGKWANRPGFEVEEVVDGLRAVRLQVEEHGRVGWPPTPDRADRRLIRTDSSPGRVGLVTTTPAVNRVDDEPLVTNLSKRSPASSR